MFIREEGVYYSLQGTVGKSSLWLFKVIYIECTLIRHCWFTLLYICVCVCVCVQACVRVCMHAHLVAQLWTLFLTPWTGIPIVGLLSLLVPVWFHLAESTSYTPEPEDNGLISEYHFGGISINIIISGNQFILKKLVTIFQLQVRMFSGFVISENSIIAIFIYLML